MTEIIQETANETSHPLSDFLKQFTEFAAPDEKLRFSIDAMRDFLSQSDSPYFKGFWEVRTLSLPLFREIQNASLRALLWNEYIELTREGRRLKNILDEESAFAVEQIDIAITALENEVSGFHEKTDEMVEGMPPLEFPAGLHFFESKLDVYAHYQQLLNLLNTYAARINALRKELIKREIRIRQKNQFFQRLSLLGDKVFPPRKDLIREISEAFVQDVGSFVQEHFDGENFSHEKALRSLFYLRDEIRGLQSLAKILTLNTPAFTTTREQLSTCWDKLKGMEKEVKHEISRHREQSEQNSALVRTKIAEVIAQFQTDQNVQVGLQGLDAIASYMRDVELRREDVLALKEEIKAARAVVQAALIAEEEKRQQQTREHQQRQQEAAHELKQRIDALHEKAANESGIEGLREEMEACRKEIASQAGLKGEKQVLERRLKVIRDLIVEKEEKNLLNISEDDREAIQKLHEILKQRKERRATVKAQLDEYRKIMGGSGLDFEKAMAYNDLLAQEKEKLEKLDEGIREIEQKIKETAEKYRNRV